MYYELVTIIKDRSAKEIDGVLVDVQTANAIVTVADGLSEENRAKLLAMPIGKMGLIAWKLVSK